MHVTYRVLFMYVGLHVILCCCRPLDDTEDVTGDADPGLMEDGEVVADLDSEEESDDEESDVEEEDAGDDEQSESD